MEKAGFSIRTPDVGTQHSDANNNDPDDGDVSDGSQLREVVSQLLQAIPDSEF